MQRLFNVSYKVDCLDFTIERYKRNTVVDMLGTEIVWMDRGFRGYKESGRLLKGGIVAYTDNRFECHFSLGGAALSEYFQSDLLRLKLFLTYIMSGNCNISRIDYAIDIKDSLRYAEIQDVIDYNGIVTRVKKIRQIVECLSSSREILGSTCYVGSGKSDKMLRIYDKAKEQGVRGDWVRFELQLRNENAINSVKAFLNIDNVLIGSFLLGLVSAFVDFRDSERKNRIAWWSDLLMGVDKVYFAGEKIDRTFEQRFEWFQRVGAVTLAMASLKYGNDVLGHKLYEMIDNGKKRMREEDYLMIGGVKENDVF